MKNDARLFVGLALSLLVGAAFFAGRHVEERRIAAQTKSLLPFPEVAPTARAEERYRTLAIGDILSLPFADFYEALRSAPKGARKKWTEELESMPRSPRRYAAASAYYKLLVQFDPPAAAKAVSEIKDKEMQTSALLTVVAAAPSSALAEMARLGFSLPHEVWPDYISGFPDDLIEQWSEVDPSATALFIESLPEDERYRYKSVLVRNWAAVDPRAARAWAERQGDATFVSDFLDGWYEDHREAAISFALAHATQKPSQEALPILLGKLYQDSPADAKKFLEQLTSDELRQKALSSFHFVDNIGSVEAVGQPELEPRTLAEWIIQFPLESWRGNLSGIFAAWQKGPPQEVLAWVEQQPTQIQGAVAAEYRAPWDKTIPEAAQAVFQFASPQLQDRLLTAMLRNGSESNEADLQKSINASSLSPAQQQHLLQLAQEVVEAKKADEVKQRAAREAARETEEGEDHGSEK